MYNTDTSIYNTRTANFLGRDCAMAGWSAQMLSAMHTTELKALYLVVDHNLVTSIRAKHDDINAIGTQMQRTNNIVNHNDQLYTCTSVHT